MADMSLESTLEKVDRSRVLYVCISFHGNDASHSVCRIKVGDLLVSNWEALYRVADLGGENLPHWMNSAMFGSKILAASGFKAFGLEVEFSKDIFSFDPFNPANGFENQDNVAVKNFTAVKSDLIGSLRSLSLALFPKYMHLTLPPRNEWPVLPLRGCHFHSMGWESIYIYIYIYYI